MTLTPDDLQNLAVVLKDGQDRTNSGILDALMKVAVGVCTAGVLWLLNTTTTLSTNVATMQAQQQSQNATLSEDISELKELGIHLKRDTLCCQRLSATSDLRCRDRGKTSIWDTTVSKRSGNVRLKKRTAGVVPSAARPSKLWRTAHTL